MIQEGWATIAATYNHNLLRFHTLILTNNGEVEGRSHVPKNTHLSLHSKNLFKYVGLKLDFLSLNFIKGCRSDPGTTFHSCGFHWSRTRVWEVD